jgi:uncharacterized protein
VAPLGRRDAFVLDVPRSLARVVILAGLSAVFGACQPGASGPVATHASAAPIVAATAPPSPLAAASWAPISGAAAESAARRVTFQASDGVELDGRLFGIGDVVVVLSHMGDPENNQSDWYAFADALGAYGYSALTYDSRGICPGGIAGCSKGSISDPNRRNDVLGAVQFARAQGARKVIVMGASLGATASLQAVLEPGSHVDGLVWVAGSLFSSWTGLSFSRDQLAAIRIPTLVIVADHDPLGVVLDSQKLYDQLSDDKRLVMPPSNLHGTDMLQPGVDPVVGGQVLEAVLEFLAPY